MTPAEAIAAAEPAEAEIRYRNQAVRKMDARGRRDAEAEQAAAWQRSTAPSSTGHLPPSSRNGGDQAAGLTSPTCGPATSPAAPASRDPSSSWRPDDLPPYDPRRDRSGERRVPAVVAAGADPGTYPGTRTRDGGTCMNGHSTKPGPLVEAGQ